MTSNTNVRGRTVIGLCGHQTGSVAEARPGAGFLKVIDHTTIAFASFAGSKQ